MLNVTKNPPVDSYSGLRFSFLDFENERISLVDSIFHSFSSSRTRSERKKVCVGKFAATHNKVSVAVLSISLSAVKQFGLKIPSLA